MTSVDAPLNGSGPQEVRIVIDYVSYSQAGNYSTWYWEIWYMQNGGTQWASDPDHYWQLTGFAVSGPHYFGIPSSWAGGSAYRLGNGYFNKTHNSDGYLSPGVLNGIINTAASNIGDGTASVSTGGIPRIPKVPDAPNAPVFVSAESDALAFTIAAPADNGGASITTYEMQILDEIAGPDDVVGSWQSGASAQTTSGKVELAPGTKYRVRYRAKNSIGFGSYSPTTLMETVAGLYVSDGTTWVAAPFEVSTGNAWENADVQISTGTVWSDPIDV